MRELLGKRLSTSTSVLETHGRDDAYTPPVKPDGVAFPESTREVSEIVKICAARRCPDVPFGVSTSLKGHVIPIYGGVNIETSRMDRVLEVHEQDLDAIVQPGSFEFEAGAD